MNKQDEKMVYFLIKEILTDLKTKLIQPLIEENHQLRKMLQEQGEKLHNGFLAVGERICQVEKKVEESPLVVLAAIRDAITQAEQEEE